MSVSFADFFIFSCSHIVDTRRVTDLFTCKYNVVIIPFSFIFCEIFLVALQAN
uniref:Uncharacterized protein n=1 Tax=Podoviridae sp. ctDwO1 TaxID=2827726 RepID=A0A8S5TAB7_9CAUD|nr:MAG TPA: hypothetical protein [Podoviridae sp. ctDwO1]